MNAPEPHRRPGRESIYVRLARIEERVGSIEANMATKADLAEMRTGIKGVEGALHAQIKGGEGALRTEIKGLEGALRTEIKGLEGALRTEIKGLEARIGWWLLGVSVLLAVGLVLQLVG
jgi:hypothetical protein